MVSQLQHDSKHDSKRDDTILIFDTLHKDMCFLKVNKVQRKTEVIIRFFSGINPKLTLRYVLTQKFKETYTYLGLDDEDKNTFTKTNTDST